VQGYGLAHIFDQVITNPAEPDADGRLHIRRRIPPDQPHGCKHCPVNLCKGADPPARGAGAGRRTRTAANRAVDHLG